MTPIENNFAASLPLRTTTPVLKAIEQETPSARVVGQALGLNSKSVAGMDIARMREVAEDFESVFLAEMVRPMFENIEAAAPFGGGQSEKIWQDMQVDEYSKAIAKNGGIGIADAVLDQLIRLQEGASSS